MHSLAMQLKFIKLESSENPADSKVQKEKLHTAKCVNPHNQFKTITATQVAL